MAGQPPAVIGLPRSSWRISKSTENPPKENPQRTQGPGQPSFRFAAHSFSSGISPSSSSCRLNAAASIAPPLPPPAHCLRFTGPMLPPRPPLPVSRLPSLQCSSRRHISAPTASEIIAQPRAPAVSAVNASAGTGCDTAGEPYKGGGGMVPPPEVHGLGEAMAELAVPQGNFVRRTLFS